MISKDGLQMVQGPSPADVPLVCLGDFAAPVPTILTLKEPPMRCHFMALLIRASLKKNGMKRR